MCIRDRYTIAKEAGVSPATVSRVLTGNAKDVYKRHQLLMTPWLIILMKNFAKSVPHEITESGKIDGAGDFKIFISLIPVSYTHLYR